MHAVAMTAVEEKQRLFASISITNSWKWARHFTIDRKLCLGDRGPEVAQGTT